MNRNKIKFKFCKWQNSPKLINDFLNEFTYRKGLRWLCFEIFIVTTMPSLSLCEPLRKYVTSGGLILTTESDEQDTIYICNRSRGFEITYQGCEIILKNGQISIYKNNDIISEHNHFEETVLNSRNNIKIK